MVFVNIHYIMFLEEINGGNAYERHFIKTGVVDSAAYRSVFK